MALCSVCGLQLLRFVLPTKWAIIVKMTDMVAEKMFKLMLVHLVLVAGFTLAFYIQVEVQGVGGAKIDPRKLIL